jgi:hypothetical protein
VETQPFARTGRSAVAAILKSSCPHLQAVVTTAEDVAESGAREGPVGAWWLVREGSGSLREGAGEVFRALAKPSFGDVDKRTARGLSSNSEGEYPSNSPGANGICTTIMDEIPSVTVVGRNCEGKPTRGTSRRRRGESE